MSKRRVYTFAISAEAAEQQFRGLVDMLRYDQARVLEADGSLIVLQADRAPTEARWASFGVYVLAQAGSSDDASAPVAWIRQQAIPKLPLRRTPRSVRGG
jgi:hypothetical protein